MITLYPAVSPSANMVQGHQINGRVYDGHIIDHRYGIKCGHTADRRRLNETDILRGHARYLRWPQLMPNIPITFEEILNE